MVVAGMILSGAALACILAPHLAPVYLGPAFVNSTVVIQVLIFNVCLHEYPLLRRRGLP